nr:aryl-sulfate sulfotransferase [uncultured Merdimonas sp.]
MNVKKKILVCICAVLVAVFGGSAVVDEIRSITRQDQDQVQTEEASGNMDVETKTGLTEDQEKVQTQIEETYNVENQQAVAEKLEKEKAAQDYTDSNMLIEYNPFGTDSQSLYVYFNTEEPVSISYNIHVKDSDIEDFRKDVWEEDLYTTEHEFQVIGLIPDMENTVTFFLTREDGSTDTREIVYEMGDLLGTEEVMLDTDMEGEAEELEDGLYAILGNDSDGLDFMYYYDNQGVLRGEIPIIGYRSHRLLFDEDSMYFSISETKMAQMNRLGQVTNVYDLGNYKLHHDYVFDDNGNMLILATDTTQDSVEDIVLRLDVNSGSVTEVLDLGDLFGSFKEECQKNSDGELDWMHINTIQWMGNGSVLLSSRETSSIIKIDSLYDKPLISYIISDKSVWKGTEYENLVFTRKGDFTIQGGQHTITYVEDPTLADGQYYLYMFDNHIGISETRPEFDWSGTGLTETSAKDGETSYYYKYLVDENAGTFELVDSFKVPYSGYVSSVQNLGDNTIVDSGMQGIFGEYDKDHELIAQYTMKAEKFIYRVFKYDFDGFYFRNIE